jgi:hypothetical protein
MKSASILLGATTLVLFTMPSLALIGCGGADPTSAGKASDFGTTTSSSDPTSECTGALPNVCTVCADGKDACAHWVIDEGKCEVEICPSAKAPVCTGALPKLCETCADGTEECAHWVVEGGKCEVEICPPAPTPICDGALPQICETCSDGKDECAHWVVEGGKCEIQICPGSTSPGPIAAP